MAYHITTGDLSLQHWTLAELFAKDGRTKVYLVEQDAAFVLREEQLTEGTHTQQVFSLAKHLKAQGLIPGVYPARHPELLKARKAAYEEGVAALLMWATTQQVRYPSPTPCDGNVPQLNPQKRGSPWLAMALSGVPGESWAVLSAGRLWNTLSADTVIGLDTVAHQLRGYGRLTVRLDTEAGRPVIAEVAPGNRHFKSIQDFPPALARSVKH